MTRKDTGDGGDRGTVLLCKLPSRPEPAYPLGLAALVPGLRAAGWNTVGVDLDFDGLDAVLGPVARHEVVAVCLSVTTPRVGLAASLVRRVKVLDPGVFVLLGGPHPTLLPREALECTGADMAVMGDGERTAAEALGFLSDGGAQPGGTAFRDGNTVNVAGGIFSEPDLDSLPVPDRNVFPVSRYGWTTLAARHPCAPMVTSRGCRLDCPFCATPALHPGGYRARSPLAVVDEMQALARDHRVRHVLIEDDAFLADPGRVEDMCACMLRRRTNTTWELANGTRPELVPLDLLPLMQRAGCRGVALGVELAWEGRRPADAPYGHEARRMRGIVKALHGAGIRVTGYFVCGMPGVSEETDAASAALACELGLDMAHFSVYLDLPGTTFHARRGVRGPRAHARATAAAGYRRFYARPRTAARLALDLARRPAVVRWTIAKGMGMLIGDPKAGERGGV